MRIDDAGPRTWLLATAAGWALLVWLLATAGMGGRVEPLPADPGLLKPLPSVRPAPASRLGAAGEYREIATRPLFSADRRPKPFVLQGKADQAGNGAFDYVLTGVLITPDLKMAILQPPSGGDSLRVRLGEAPQPQPDWRLVTLNPRSAVFEGPDGRHTLDLRVFAGVGGQAPTEVSRERRPETMPGADQVPVTPPPVGSVDDAASPAVPTPAAGPAQTNGTAPATRGEATQRGTTRREADQPMTDQAQMDAIRQRIQERRAKLRGKSPAKPPAQSP